MYFFSCGRVMNTGEKTRGARDRWGRTVFGRYAIPEAFAPVHEGGYPGSRRARPWPGSVPLPSREATRFRTELEHRMLDENWFATHPTARAEMT